MEESKNIMRNIITEVMKVCTSRKIDVEEHFVVFLVQLLNLNPNRGISDESITERQTIQNLIEFIVSMIKNIYDPKTVTLRIQHDYDYFLENMEKIIHEHRCKLKLKIKPLLDSIIEPKDKHTEKSLYEKIAYYVTLAVGLGNPSEVLVFKEALQALHSVFLRDEIEAFPYMLNYIRQEVLSDVTKLTTGVRLFNKYTNKGGEGIPDLKRLLDAAVSAVLVQMKDIMQSLDDRCTLLTTVIRYTFRYKKIRNDYVLEPNQQCTLSNRQRDYIKDLLVTYHQTKIFVRDLIGHISDVKLRSQETHEKYIDTLAELNKIIIPNMYTPVDIVYPYFREIHDLWYSLQGEIIALQELTNIFAKQIKAVTSLTFDESLRDNICASSVTLLTEKDSIEYNLDNDNVEIIHPENLNILDLEFSGYCCWTMVNTEGALIPADSSLGIAKFNDRYYGFASVEAGISFCKKPNYYITMATIFVRENIELINCLDLLETLDSLKDVKEIVKEDTVEHNTTDKELQVDTHILPPNIDLGYHWNIWDYKRDVLNMVHLLQCQTKSTNTKKTYSKFNKKLQTTTPKDAETQTKIDNYANTLRPKNFIYGLRGRKDDKQFIIDLSKPDKIDSEM